MKGNQPTIHDDLAAIDWSRARWGAEVVEKAHGRLEVRRCTAVDLDAAQWNGRCDLYGRRQAARVERERTVLNTGQTTREVAYCLTSLGADQAGPDELARLVRGHWEVENRLHYVRDFSDDEDRCRAAARHLPRNLAALSNAAISIVRVLGRFRHIPPRQPPLRRPPAGCPGRRAEHLSHPRRHTPRPAAPRTTAPRNPCARARPPTTRVGTEPSPERETDSAKPPSYASASGEPHLIRSLPHVLVPNPDARLPPDF